MITVPDFMNATSVVDGILPTATDETLSSIPLPGITQLAPKGPKGWFCCDCGRGTLHITTKKCDRCKHARCGGCQLK